LRADKNFTAINFHNLFSDRQQLTQACRALRQHNFSLKNVAAIPATERAIKGAISGGSTGGLLALIGGLSVMLIPGVGIPLAAESLLTVMMRTGVSSAVLNDYASCK
jgi:Mg/Co/Ni transporter MgtE